jgi:hypothetical protein
MCEPASFVLTKDRVFWSMTSDSHEDIIEEHGLHADGVGGPNIVRVEITPPENRFDAPADEWTFRVDQEDYPEWLKYQSGCPTDAIEKRAREALADWIAARVIRDGERKVTKGVFWAYGSSQVTACENSQVKAYGSSQVTAYENSQVTAYGSSQVTAYENSQVTACDSSQVKAYGSSQVTAYENSQVTACENSATARIYNSATFEPPKGQLAVVLDCRSGVAIPHVGS